MSRAETREAREIWAAEQWEKAKRNWRILGRVLFWIVAALALAFSYYAGQFSALKITCAQFIESTRRH